jgi:hypothetical protein
MKRVFLILFIIIISCKKYNLVINDKYRTLLNTYQLNDTLHFADQHGDLDTIRIAEIDSIEQEPNLMSTSPPMKEIYIRIEHLPKNNWISNEIVDSNEKPKNQPFITIANWHENCCQIRINYRDFENEDDPAFETVKEKIDTLYSYPGSRFKPTLDKVTELYWSNTKGIIGYKKKNGKKYYLKE